METNEDLLLDYNSWNVHIERQQHVCKKHLSNWNPINKNWTIRCGPDLMDNPIHGSRHSPQHGQTGWDIWTGDLAESNDFFSSMKASDLLQIRPELIQYLGLDVGFQFTIHNDGVAVVYVKSEE